MRINDALMQEVFRRAEVIREKQLQRRKLLMGLSCVVLSLALLFLLNGKTGMTVASYTESYGSLVFEGSGSHYIIIAVVFFFLGCLVGLGADRLYRQWHRKRVRRYTQKWIGDGGASISRIPRTPASAGKS